MTAVDVDALDKLREAAALGSLRVGEHYGIHLYAGDNPVGTTLRASDATLIAAAVTALPDLIAEVRRGRARDEVLEKLIATAPVVWNGDYPVKAVPLSDLLSLDALAVVAAVDGGEQ